MTTPGESTMSSPLLPHTTRLRRNVSPIAIVLPLIFVAPGCATEYV